MKKLLLATAALKLVDDGRNRIAGTPAPSTGPKPVYLIYYSIAPEARLGGCP